MQTLPGADHRVLLTGTGGGARRALRLLAVAMLVGLLLGATPLRQWTESLPNSLGWMNPLASWWETMAARTGLTRPYAAIRARFRAIEAP